MPPRPRKPGPFTWEEARYWTNYDPETGVVTWAKPKSKIRPGAEVGWETYKGYRYFEICGTAWYTHVFIWFWMTGERPPKKMQVDHINRVRNDNRWSNLRLSTAGENQANTDRYGEMRGITPITNSRGVVVRYRVRVRHRTLGKHLGYFKTLEEAKRVYREEATKIYGEFYAGT